MVYSMVVFSDKAMARGNRRCCILGCTCPDTATSLDKLGYNCFVISYITLNLWYVFTMQVSKLKWNDCTPSRHRLNSAKALLCVTWCFELTVPPTTQYLRHKMCTKRLFTVYRVQKVWKVFVPLLSMFFKTSTKIGQFKIYNRSFVLNKIYTFCCKQLFMLYNFI